jgi:creatinine amidohydrolase
MTDRLSSVRWQDLTREEVRSAAAAGAVIVQPMGSIEQHGPHLPVDTDAFTAERVAVRAAQQAETPTLVTPTVWWGASEYWMEFGGTLPLRPELLVELLSELVDGMARNGFRRVLLLNGHAGNVSAMHAVAMRHLRREVRVVGLNYWSLAAETLKQHSRTDRGRIGHAGEIETSLQLALRPEAVRSAQIPAELQTLPPTLLPADIADMAVVPPDPAHDTLGGIWGVPSAASPALGTAILDATIERLVAFLQVFATTPLPARFVAPEVEHP